VANVNFYSRDFRTIRTDLVNYIRNNYSDYYNDFNDASIGMMLLELNAAVGEMLSFNTDRAFQETMIDYAQERRSLYSIARTFGLKIPPKTSSVCIVDITFDLPVSGNSFDLDYAPIILRGAQVVGGGVVFETVNDVNFSSPFSQNGIPNRTIIPNYNQNGVIVSYAVTKREVAINGVTKIFKRDITAQDNIPFLEIVLPEPDILSITDVIELEGINLQRLPTLSEWINPDNKWYEVESLSETSIFTPDVDATVDNPAIFKGKWEQISKKFMVEYTDKGYCILRFGNGYQDTSFFNDYVSDSDMVLKMLDGQINNLSLGEIPRTKTTIYVRYRTGGGTRSNVGANVLTSLSTANIFILGQDNAKNTKVRTSARVNNPIPALGGKDELTVENIRHLIKYNFSAQNRAVTLKDYYVILSKMSGTFGSPSKLLLAKNDNQIEVIIATLDQNGFLTNQSTDILRENIAEYLSKYKMLNDYITVTDGKIINFSIEATLYITPNSNTIETLQLAVQSITQYFEDKKEFGQNIYLASLYEILNKIDSVLNVSDIKIFHKQGQGFYSLNSPSNPYLDTTTKQLDTSKYQALMVNYDEIYELKYPNKDILIKFVY
jgi:hypothetical protein